MFSDDLMFNIREETCTIVGDGNHHDLIINSPGNEGNVSVYVDGKLFAVEQLIGGKAVIHINDLTFGNHIISTYINDSPMWYDVDQELFIKKDSKLSLKDVSSEYKVEISAKYNKGIDELLEVIQKILRDNKEKLMN